MSNRVVPAPVHEAVAAVISNQDKLLSDGRRAAMLDPNSILNAMQYLYWFGYLAYNVAKIVRPADVSKALKTFQKWFGVENADEKGKIGLATLRAMSYPRCGCPDCVDPDKKGRHANYLKLQTARMVQQKKWKKHGLTYYIKSFVKSGKLDQLAQEAIIAKAWEQWAAVAKIDIRQVKTAAPADLIIDTGAGPNFDFDGPAGTLAWAYMPDGSDRQLVMRFDLDENWIGDKKDNGVCMLNVACHEFGHMLGLDHSSKQQALMAPFYNESVDSPQQTDDIPRVQQLYGKP